MDALVQHPFSVLLVRCSKDGAMCARTCVLFSSNCSVRHFCRLASGVLSDALGSRPVENSSCSDWTTDATSSRCFLGHKVTTFRTLGHHRFQLFLGRLSLLKMVPRLISYDRVFSILAFPPQGASESPTQRSWPVRRKAPPRVPHSISYRWQCTKHRGGWSSL